MSRLTHSLFNAPSPYQFPRSHPIPAAPPSPPETTNETIGPTRSVPSSISVAGPISMTSPEHKMPNSSLSTAPTESPAARFRRVGSVAYHAAGFGDTRQRSSPRSHRAFVVVIPPPIILQERGLLGHTLAAGPQHRLSQGLLMPLFPTMYAQLTAIAKEFNFPSSAGLCLYMHYSDNGITVTPRISDDSWPLIWGHAFDASPSGSGPRPPIFGKIEFDIDIRTARWYSSWLASAQRQHHDVPVSVPPSVAPSASMHQREASRTTFTDTIMDDNQDANSLQPQPQPRTRHIPRQLSLVDRLEPATERHGSGPSSQSPSPRAAVASAAQTLSPIYQESEPKSAKHDLEIRVNNWRASASLTPSALVARGQTSLEPANMPNNIQLDDSEPADAEDEELNLADFQWSVSSLGPGDDELPSPVPSSPRPFTPDMARRMWEDAPVTPSTATSWGPPSGYLDWDVESIHVPSLDLGERMGFSRPVTPSTATSWGPTSVDFDWEASPSSRASSVDLADRAIFSRPVTPMTATSWGPASWPASPIEYSRAPSVHLAMRGEFSRPATPSTATSWSPPSSYPPSPATPFYVHTPDAGQRAFDLDAPRQQGKPWAFGWPYVEVNRMERRDGEAEVSTSSPSAPSLLDDFSSSSTKERSVAHKPWEHVWPYATFGRNENAKLAPGYPPLVIYPHVSEVRREKTHSVVVLSKPVDYPNFDIYPAVRLHNMPVSRRQANSRPAVNKVINVDLASSYPNVTPYPAAYPHFDLYPKALEVVSKIVPSSAAPGSNYPYIVLYPSVYPHFEIYSKGLQMPFTKSAPLVSLSTYPNLVIYQAIYPHLEIYPNVLTVGPRKTITTKNFRSMAVSRKPVPSGVLSSYSYPNIVIYPAVHTEGSPKVSRAASQKAAQSTSCSYPSIVLYPAIYPHLEIYPSALTVASRKTILVGSTGVYPNIVIYRPVYPHLGIYPSALTIASRKTISIGNTGDYPNIVIYRPVYPHIEVYPTAPTIAPSKIVPSSAAQGSSYPFIALCPSVYPRLEIYLTALAVKSRKMKPAMARVVPSLGRVTVQSSTKQPVDVGVRNNYPTFDLYPAVYPTIRPYAPVGGSMKATRSHVTFRLAAQYPAFDIYPVVYPSFELYVPLDTPKIVTVLRDEPGRYGTPPDVAPASRPALLSNNPFKELIDLAFPSEPVKATRKTHKQLHDEVFPDGGPVRKQPSKTHRQLHDMVFPNGVPKRPSLIVPKITVMDKPISLPGTPAPLLQRRRTHKELHDEVFPTGRVTTPSGTWNKFFQDNASMSRPQRRPAPSSRALPGSAVRQTIAGAPTGLPPSPDYLKSLSSRPRRSPDVPEDVGSGLRRSVSSVTPSNIPTRRAQSDLPSLEERSNVSLSRSASIATPNRAPSLSGSSPLEQAATTPARRKRDSLVMQRVRAINGGTPGASEEQLSVASLSQFPMPPRPAPQIPVPPIPTRTPAQRISDRSRNLNT